MNDNKYIDLGERCFGPFLLGFILWLNRALDSSGYERVYFFSRDGYMMDKAWNILFPEEIQSRYVYFSRKSLIHPLLWKCESYRESLRYLPQQRYLSVAKLLSYYGFDEHQTAVVINRHSLELSREYRFEDVFYDHNLEEVYHFNKETIDDNSRMQWDLLLEYLREIEMNGKCAIVDIGWHGGLQYYLEEFVRQAGLQIEFEGYYVGIAPRIDLTGRVHGYAYEDAVNPNRKKLLCFLGVLEKLFQSLEGSTLGYERQSNGKAGPVIRQHEYQDDDFLISRIETIQEGALRYIQSHRDDRTISFEESARKLLRFGMNPTLAETNLFRDFFIEDGDRNYFIMNKPMREYSFDEFKYALSNSVWKTGFMKSALKLPLPYYWLYRMLRK